MYKNGSIKRVTAELTLVSLTDDRLHSTPEALLSRVASLEEKLASGNLINAGALKPQPSPKTEEAPKTEKATATDEEKMPSSAKPLPFWSDVVHTVEGNKPWAAAYLKGTKAYWDGTNVTVILSDSFSLNLVNDEVTRTAIASGINLCDDTMAVNQSNIKFRFDRIAVDDDPIESLK